MSATTARRLAWAMWIVALGSIAVAAILELLYPTETTTTAHPVSNFIWAFSWFGFGLVGAVIVSSRPRNRIGWVLCGVTFGVGVSLLAPAYAALAYRRELALGGLATWVSTWAFVVTIGLVGALLLLFPDGRLASRRRRWAAWALAIVIGCNAVIYAVLPGPPVGDAPPFNPLGIEALGPQLQAATEIAGPGLALVMLLVLVDMLIRFWRSRGVERLQFRWFALAALAFPVGFFFVNAVAGEPSGFDPITLVFFVCGNGLAVAIGIAVTRYGLYEINRVLSRTITYLVLTVLLVALYLAAVTVLTAVTAPVTRDSPAAVAIATLAAAAVFRPARRRIQSTVDRRFNRARYDAARTVDTYRARLRDEVDIAALSDDLLETVSSSMQPTAAALWLRDGAAANSQEILQQPSVVTVPERRSETRGM